MKKTWMILMALIFTLGSASFAEGTLTHYDGKCGFTMEYPAELLEVHSYGTNTTFVAIAENDIMNMTILPDASVAEDPVQKLVSIMQEYAVPAGSEDVRHFQTAAGAEVYACQIPLEDAMMEEFLLQQDGREFYISIYLHTDVKDKYLNAAEDMVLSFSTDPNGDFSGYEEEETMEDMYEPDYFSTMIDQYAPVLRLWGTAVWEKWDMSRLYDWDVSPLLYLMDHQADQVHIDFVQLAREGTDELILYTLPADGSIGTDLLAVYAADANGTLFISALSAERDHFSLCGDEDNGYVLREDCSNSAFQSGVLFWQMTADGNCTLIDAVIFEAAEDGSENWYRTHDMDWDVSNDEPISPEEAQRLMDAYPPCDQPDAAYRLSDYMEWEMELMPEYTE